MFFVFSQLLCKPVLQFDQLNFQGFESRYLKIHIALIRTNLSFCSNFEKVLESYLFFSLFFCQPVLQSGSGEAYNILDQFLFCKYLDIQ